MASPTKRDLDRRMLRTLKAMARRRGEDHHAVTLPHWTNHDLRRVVRSGLSALRVPHDVAEAVLAHRPPGIVGTYDTHDIGTRSARRWRRGRSTLRPSSTRAAARQGRQAAEAAAMINVEFFTYTDAQWNAIKAVVRDALGRDADQIERQITPVTRTLQHHRDGAAAEPHRDRGEPVSSAQCRQPSKTAPR